ncbi:MAG: AmmeMemoRadiSam system radical SAM enzyme [Treponema sp.]|nr:AmmeMemoRadiSam system radical SAM enzyme [Treponema sp.]
MNKIPLFMNEDTQNVCCDLCPNNCKIKNGDFGLCGVRGNKSGKAVIPFYGFITALAIDPIEKKPLYRFKPKTKILSLGFTGCNLRCPFCQNWHISQNTANHESQNERGRIMMPAQIISTALEHGTPSIAYTYSEPLVHIEYIIDCMKLARENGIANVLVTNGCVKKEAAAKILKYTDAINVDLKCFSAQTYKECLGYNISDEYLETVKDFIKLCYEMNVHLEITTLVVPDLNNTKEELNAACDFILSIDKKIPWHLTAYHPDYRWNAPPTDRGFLLSAAEEARKKLEFVYTGNI